MLFEQENIFANALKVVHRAAIHNTQFVLADPKRTPFIGGEGITPKNYGKNQSLLVMLCFICNIALKQPLPLPDNPFMKPVPLFIILLASCSSANAQSRTIDSLCQVIRQSPHDSTKLKNIFLLNEHAVNPDTLLPYIIQAEKITKQTSNEGDAARTGFCRATYYARKEYIDSALTIINRLIDKFRYNQQEQQMYLSFLFFRSKIYDRANQYSKAVSSLVEVVQTAELQHDTAIQIQAKTGIGWVQMEMEQYREALKWFQKALHTSHNKKYYEHYSALYSNTATAYNALSIPDSATLYIDTAINIARRTQNSLFLATSLSMQAKILIAAKKPALAEASLKEALEIRKQIDDPFYTVYDMSTLASYYAHNNQPGKGIKLCQEGIALARQTGLTSQLLMIYRSMAENYLASGDTREYGRTLEYVIALKDSFNTINSSRLIAELQASNEAQKQEIITTEQRLTLIKKNYWLTGSFIFALMAGAIILLAFENFRRKQNTRMTLALEREKQIAAQSVQAAEEQERKRIAADLHDNIGAYASAIRANVEKLSPEQPGPPNPVLQNLRQHSQEIIDSLRDTIWVLNKDHVTLTGISDRIKTYIGKIQPSYSNIIFTVHEEIEHDARIRSQTALNIFRIAQESVHNALKHSGAKNICLAITGTANVLQMTITDDGNGMPVPALRSTGNGIANMRARAAESGLQLLVENRPEGGTSVKIELTTSN